MTATDFLKIFLSDTYSLMLKTHVFHWNVTGDDFRSLHMMFEEQYIELFAAADVLAERIRALGQYAPGGMKTYAHMSSIKEPALAITAQEMIAALIEDHGKMAVDARQGISIAAHGDDHVTADILIGRIREHEKRVWMMKSILGYSMEESSVIEKPARRSRKMSNI